MLTGWFPPEGTGWPTGTGTRTHPDQQRSAAAVLLRAPVTSPFRKAGLLARLTQRAQPSKVLLSPLY
ncbi:MAG: hypothetical protein M3Y33_21700 [Actinomycetota bacterium]|nr:hypothetical protein [Actinomycetota bacterium]